MIALDEKHRIRTEFEEGGKSLYWLAAHNPIPYSTLWSLANREKWGRYGEATSKSPKKSLETRLQHILQRVLDRLEVELNQPTSGSKIPSTVSTRLDSAVKTYLKLLDIQAKLGLEIPSPNTKKGVENVSSTGNRSKRDALIKSLLRRFDVLRISGETEIRNLLTDRT